MHNRILAAIELAEDPAERVLDTAASFLQEGGSLDVIHVLEPWDVSYSFDPSMSGGMMKRLEESAVARASERLAALVKPYNVDASCQHVQLGRAATAIRDRAKADSVDLIVMGTHGARGWRRLLGSTANEVLHGTACNILMCRLHE